MNPNGSGPTLRLPTVGSAIKMLIGLNVVVYILMLVAMQLGWTSLSSELALNPRAFFTGSLWQAVTSVIIHDPTSPTHLLFNMLWLWLFGSQYEAMVGPKRFLKSYIWAGLGGVVVTLLVGAVGLLLPSLPIAAPIANQLHLGASGAVMGILMAWAGAMGDRKINLFLLGEMKAKTFALIIVGIEILRLLSFDHGTSTTMHLGGMATGWAIGIGAWPPDRKKAALKREKKRIEKQLRKFEVIEGGGEGTPGDRKPRGWVGIGGTDDDGGPLVH